MKPADISELIRPVPPNLPLYGYTIQGEDYTIADLDRLWTERYIRAVDDPAFGYEFVSAFASRNEFLPLSKPPCWSHIDTWWHLSGRVSIPAVREAIAIREPANAWKRALLHALLVIPSATEEEISGIVGIPIESLRIYEELLWNVRDNQDCLASVVWPRPRFELMIDPKYFHKTEPADLLLRAAYEGLETNLLIELHSRLSQERRLTEQEICRYFNNGILINAKLMAKMGFYDPKSLTARLANKIYQADARVKARAEVLRLKELAKPRKSLKSVGRVLTGKHPGRLTRPIMGRAANSEVTTVANLILGIKNPKWTYLAKLGEGSDVSEGSEGSGINRNETFLNPALAFIPPATCGREMSCAFETPNRWTMVPVTSM